MFVGARLKMGCALSNRPTVSGISTSSTISFITFSLKTRCTTGSDLTFNGAKNSRLKVKFNG